MRSRLRTYRRRRGSIQRKDPVTPVVYAQVRARDRGCVGPRVGMEGECFGFPELDHIRASGGLALRSRSAADNLVTLCSTHHRVKTEGGRVWRPKLIAWVESKQEGAA